MAERTPKIDEPKTTSEVKLPNYFDLATAAGIAGAEKAQKFFDEVAFIAVGNISQHRNPGILEIAFFWTAFSIPVVFEHL